MSEMVVNAVSKNFNGRTILNNVDFRLKRNEILGIFGRNGTGKSTLLKLLYGTMNADVLSMEINGKTFNGSHRKLGDNAIIKNQLIGYLPQFSFLPASMRVWNVIPLFHPAGEAQDRIFNAPRLGSFSKKKVGELSIGERRYLEIQLVGNLDHPFLFLDEPFSMVEPLYAEVISQLILDLKPKKGIIITDHYYKNVWDVATAKKVLTHGRLHDANEMQDLVDLGYLNSL